MDDLISRQAAIVEMRVINDSICEQQAIDALCELPPAQPEQRWIPVSERLPDLGIEVLLNEGYSCTVGYLIKTTDGKHEWGVNGWYNDLEDWSAWMPLPEPYREGE